MTTETPAAPQTPFDGAPHVPGLVAILAAVGCIAGAVLIFRPVVPEDAQMLERLLDNGMCRIILAIGLAALFYGVLELIASRCDATGTVPELPWLVGRREVQIPAETWRALNEQRLAPLGFAVFALPLLGFIGTVIGISGAIGELADLFDGEDRTAALAEVLSELRFAFDTTFAGLAAVLPVALLSMFIRNAATEVEAHLARLG